MHDITTQQDNKNNNLTHGNNVPCQNTFQVARRVPLHPRLLQVLALCTPMLILMPMTSVFMPIQDSKQSHTTTYNHQGTGTIIQANHCLIHRLRYLRYHRQCMHLLCPISQCHSSHHLCMHLRCQTSQCHSIHRQCMHLRCQASQCQFIQCQCTHLRCRLSQAPSPYST